MKERNSKLLTSFIKSRKVDVKELLICVVGMLCNTHGCIYGESDIHNTMFHLLNDKQFKHLKKDVSFESWEYNMFSPEIHDIIARNNSCLGLSAVPHMSTTILFSESPRFDDYDTVINKEKDYSEHGIEPTVFYVSPMGNMMWRGIYDRVLSDVEKATVLDIIE